MTTSQITALIIPALRHPNLYQCREEKRGEVAVFRIAVHGADYGRVCGKGGANLEALNTLVQAVDENARVILEAPLTDDRREIAPENQEWDPAPVAAMLKEWFAATEAPGDLVFSSTPRSAGTYDVFFSVPPPPEIVHALAKWASVAARTHGGRVCINGAHYATF